MAYVSMIKGNIPFLLFSYLMPNWDIVSKDEIVNEYENLDDMIKADHISLLQAQNNAVLAAYQLANKKVEIKEKTNHIVYISKEANTDIKMFDELISIEGNPVNDLSDIKKIISSYQEGDTVSLKVRREEKELDVKARVYNTDDGLKIGIAIATTYEYETDPSVELKSKSSESGPSGGLMMALYIYNSLVEDDITKGKKVIGTGTINQDGTVGEIGGVKYKLLGAVRKKADIFLVPEGNYEEAVNVKNEKNLEIRIISVKTLEEAVKVLNK